jgi:hypothetical protein
LTNGVTSKKLKTQPFEKCKKGKAKADSKAHKNSNIPNFSDNV